MPRLSAASPPVSLMGGLGCKGPSVVPVGTGRQVSKDEPQRFLGGWGYGSVNKVLAVLAQDLNLSPRTDIKAPGMIAHTCVPSAGKAKTRGFLGLDGQTVYPQG